MTQAQCNSLSLFQSAELPSCDEGDEDQEIMSPREVDRLVLDVRPTTGMEIQQEEEQPAINPKLQELLDRDLIERPNLGVEEIFDILPLYGTLKVSIWGGKMFFKG